MRFLSRLLLLTILPFSVTAAQQVAAGRGPNYNPRSGEGSFDLMTYVDAEALINVSGSTIAYRLVSGAPVQDAGSNFSQPIPQAVFGTFNMEKIAGRGVVTLVEEPSARNHYTAVIRIRDDKGGRDLYHVRLSWTWNPANPSRPPFGEGGERIESRNNTPEHYDRDRDGIFQFTGRVDDVTVLRIRADQVRAEILSGQPLRDPKFQFSQPLPAEDLQTIELAEIAGRGQVELVEKPWAGNRYTAVVRITDKQGGSGAYSFKLAWRR